MLSHQQMLSYKKIHDLGAMGGKVTSPGNMSTSLTCAETPSCKAALDMVRPGRAFSDENNIHAPHLCKDVRLHSGFEYDFVPDLPLLRTRSRKQRDLGRQRRSFRNGTPAGLGVRDPGASADTYEKKKGYAHTIVPNKQLQSSLLGDKARCISTTRNTVLVCVAFLALNSTPTEQARKLDSRD